MLKSNLSRLLCEKNIRQSELAQSTGVRPSTICDICNNNATYIKLETLEKICRFLECDINMLFKIC